MISKLQHEITLFQNGTITTKKHVNEYSTLGFPCRVNREQFVGGNKKTPFNEDREMTRDAKN